MKYNKHIECAVAYGIGYICGKHNIKISKKEIKRAAKKGLLFVHQYKSNHGNTRI